MFYKFVLYTNKYVIFQRSSLSPGERSLGGGHRLSSPPQQQAHTRPQSPQQARCLYVFYNVLASLKRFSKRRAFYYLIMWKNSMQSLK